MRFYWSAMENTLPCKITVWFSWLKSEGALHLLIEAAMMDNSACSGRIFSPV